MATNADYNRTLRGAILRKLRAATVYDQFVNRDLVRGSFSEPEDTVQVKTLGSVTTSSYSGSLPTPEDIATDNDSISADHKEAFAFKAPADDSASAVADMFAQEGVAELMKSAQQYVLGLYTGASLQVTYDPANDSIRDKIAEAGIKLDNAEAPDGAENRWLVLPPSEVSDIGDDFIDTSPTGLSDQVLRMRFAGTYKGFRIYKVPSSHFTVTGSAPAYAHAMAGIRTSIAYEDALLNVRRVPSTDFSGDQIDGLHVGGGTIIRDGATVDFRIKQ